jgi:hypothetical protein
MTRIVTMTLIACLTILSINACVNVSQSGNYDPAIIEDLTKRIEALEAEAHDHEWNGGTIQVPGNWNSGPDFLTTSTLIFGAQNVPCIIPNENIVNLNTED